MAEWRASIAWLAAALLLPALAAATERPPVWRIDGRHNTVFLFGSMHLLPEGEFNLDGALGAAYQRAATIYLEVDLNRYPPAELAAITAARAIDPERRTLDEMLGADAAEVSAAAAAAGLELSPYAGFEPWFVGLSVAANTLERRGYRQSSGVERLVARRADLDGKDLRGLETLDEQLALLDTLPASRQGQFLLKALQESQVHGDELGSLLQAWRAGDDAALAAHVARDFAATPELLEPLIHARNRRWADQIEAMLAAPEDVLVIVGALHLIGEQGLVRLLERRGWKAERSPRG